jgi:hypothetical protein
MVSELYCTKFINRRKEGISVWVATFFFSSNFTATFQVIHNIAIEPQWSWDYAHELSQSLFRGINWKFWNRWHISLSTWFRDYLYIPMGGNRFLNPAFV